MKRSEWTDRRKMTYGLLLFTAGLVSYAVLAYPLAPRESLISATVEALVTACVFVITGYTVGRVASKHRAFNKGADDDLGADKS